MTPLDLANELFGPEPDGPCGYIEGCCDTCGATIVITSPTMWRCTPCQLKREQEYRARRIRSEGADRV